MPLAAHTCENSLEKMNCSTNPHMGLATGQRKEAGLVCDFFFFISVSNT